VPEDPAAEPPPVNRTVWWSRLEAAERPWVRRWWRLIFPAVFLVYLIQAASGVSEYQTGVTAVVGYAVLVAFAGAYLVAMSRRVLGSGQPMWSAWVAMLVLWLIAIPLAHEYSAVLVTYLVVIVVSTRGFRAFPLVVVLALAATFVPALVPAWHAPVNTDAGISIAVVALAMFGFFGVVQTNRALEDAREEVARLAAENERTRIARDLHDVLGHSLTTITMKSALAHRLLDRDPARARDEMMAVEELSRQALAEVRATVAGYREPTLTGELATGRELLRAAGVEAALPSSVEAVPPGHRVLFAWVVREGLTNVVRHARAGSCTVALGATWVEVTDDGRAGAGDGDGSGAGTGHGLVGLRERVAAAGGTLVAGRASTGGWRLRVDVPEPAVGPDPVPDPPDGIGAGVPGGAAGGARVDRQGCR
jgi:two-component system sensor histidine kinase DesK